MVQSVRAGLKVRPFDFGCSEVVVGSVLIAIQAMGLLVMMFVSWVVGCLYQLMMIALIGCEVVVIDAVNHEPSLGGLTQAVPIFFILNQHSWLQKKKKLSSGTTFR